MRRPRAPLTRLIALSATAVGSLILASLASASVSSFAYDATTDRLAITVGNGQTMEAIADPNPLFADGTYTFLLTGSNWSGTDTADITGAGTPVLTVDTDFSGGGATVSGIEVTGTGAAMVLSGTTRAWHTPLLTLLDGPTSNITTRTVTGPVAFSGADNALWLDAARVTLTGSITSAANVSAAGPGGTDGVVTIDGDITATTVNLTGDLRVGPAAPRRIEGTGQVSMNGVVGNALVGRGPHAAGLAASLTLAAPVVDLSRGVTMNGALTVEQDGWDRAQYTRLGGAVDMPGGRLQVGGELRVSGAPSQTLRTGELVTAGGLTPDALGCRSAGPHALCRGVSAQRVFVPTTDLTVDARWVNRFTAYMPGNITVTAATTTLPVPGGPNTNSSLQAGGRLDLQGGVQVPVDGAMVVTGSPTILAGATAPAAAGSIGAAACNPGPLMSTGDLQVTAPIECLSDLTTGPGTTLLAADVTTTGHQAYSGPATVALDGTPRHLRAGGQAGVRFNVALDATWGGQPGDVEGYRVTATPGDTGCSAGPEARSCAFAVAPEGNDITFELGTRLRSAALPDGAKTPTAADRQPLPSGRTTRRSVARGSRTPLTTLIVPPRSKGRRTWAEQGPCRISRGRLLAPKYSGTCTVILRVAKHRRTKAWNGRAVVDVG